MDHYFDALPIDLQDKICEKIVYQPLSAELIKDIKSTRYSHNLYNMQKLFIKNPKKIVGLTDTLQVLKNKNLHVQASQFEIIITDLIDKD